MRGHHLADLTPRVVDLRHWLLPLSGWLIGLAIAVIIVFDTLVDPWIGALSDRLTGTRLGRRHSLMFAAILLLALLGLAGLAGRRRR